MCFCAIEFLILFDFFDFNQTFKVIIRFVFKSLVILIIRHKISVKNVSSYNDWLFYVHFQSNNVISFGAISEIDHVYGTKTIPNGADTGGK